MDLRKLQHAALLAETRHFARAAERAHLTQSALSRSIQALETELDLRLFDRSQGGVALTAPGRQLLERARPLLRSAANLAHDMRMLRDAEIGELAAGAGPFPAATLLPQALARLRETHPGLSVTLHIDHSIALCASLEAERIELFVADTRSTRLPEDFVVRPLATQHGSLFCRASHPKARRRRLAMSDLKGERFASVHLPAQVHEVLRRTIGTPASNSWAFTCDNVYLLKDLAMQTDLILICTRQALARELAAGEFVQLKPAGFEPWPVQVGAVSLRGRTLSPAAELLLAQLAELAGSKG